MKQFLLSLVVTITTLTSFGQIDILWDDDPGVNYNGQTINITKDYAGFDVYMHCQNTGSSPLDIKFRRVVLSSNDTLFNDQFCDNNLCYSCFGDDWTTPASNPLQTGDSCLMKGTFYFYDGGNVLIRYYIVDVFDNPIDSVDVNITNTVGFQDKFDNISIYPNPTEDVININFSNKNYEKLNYQLFDINGREIINTLLTLNQNLIDLTGLNSGIYTLKIYNQENLLKKSKIIKR